MYWQVYNPRDTHLITRHSVYQLFKTPTQSANSLFELLEGRHAVLTC